VVGKEFRKVLVLTAIAILVSAIVLAVLQRYVAAFIALLSGVAVLSYVGEAQHEERS
jgi:hypothetical protein